MTSVEKGKLDKPHAK